MLEEHQRQNGCWGRKHGAPAAVKFNDLAHLGTGKFEGLVYGRVAEGPGR